MGWDVRIMYSTALAGGGRVSHHLSSVSLCSSSRHFPWIDKTRDPGGAEE